MDSQQFNRAAKVLRNQFSAPPITIFTREQVQEIIAIDRLEANNSIDNRVQHMARTFAVSAQQIRDILERNGNYGHYHFDEAYPAQENPTAPPSAPLQ